MPERQRYVFKKRRQRKQQTEERNVLGKRCKQKYRRVKIDRGEREKERKAQKNNETRIYETENELKKQLLSYINEIPKHFRSM